MNIKQLRLLVLILSMTAYQNLFAHGSGGDSSYDLDKKDPYAERAAEKQATENKQDQDNWADFMKAIDSPKSEGAGEAEEAKTINDHDHHGEASH